MPSKKQAYNWAKVKPGDIISFRYKSKSGKARVQTILVLNPRITVKLKDKSTTKQLIGIKLEESNKIELRLTQRQVVLFEKIGDLIKIDDKNNLYKLNINNIKGIKKEAYDKISKGLGIEKQYRTYDYLQAKKSAVYLEPIKVFTDED